MRFDDSFGDGEPDSGSGAFSPVQASGMEQRCFLSRHGIIVLRVPNADFYRRPSLGTSDGFRASSGKACKAVGVVGVTFNDLRGTAVTRLALVGATETEIATITGHSLRDVRAILDMH